MGKKRVIRSVFTVGSLFRKKKSNTAVVCLDNTSGDRKSKTGTVWFCSDKRFKKFSLLFFGDGSSVIYDIDLKAVLFFNNRKRYRLCGRFKGVAEQIGKSLI